LDPVYQVRRYFAQISQDVWEHPSTRSLSLPSKGVLAFLLSGPNSGRFRHGLREGIYFANLPVLAAELNAPHTDVRDSLEELERTGLIVFDDRHGIIAVPAFVSPTKNLSELICIVQRLDKLPPCRPRNLFLTALVSVCRIHARSHWKKERAELPVHVKEWERRFSLELESGENALWDLPQA